MSKALISQRSLLDVYHSRPFIDNDTGLPCVIRNGEQIVVNDGALLRYDEWKDIDQAVVKAAVDRLSGISAIIGRGLVHNLGSIGVTISQWQEESDMTEANYSMSGVTAGEEDTPAYDTASVPVPVVHKDFRINIRRLEASRRMGEALDVTAAATAGRKVAEASEDMLFSSTPIAVGGASIYGFTNFPARNTVVLGTPWDDLANGVNEVLVEGVRRMIASAIADKFYGPYALLIPGAYEAKFLEDYRANDSRTVKQRVLGIDKIQDVIVCDRLTGDNVILVQMTRDVVDLAVAQQISTVSWSENGGMTNRFKTMAVWVPRLKQDYDGKCGIVHATFSS